MQHFFLTASVLLPFVLWDAVRCILLKRGDQSTTRRAAVERHFTSDEIADGRRLIERHNRLLPISRALYYAFFLTALFLGGAARLEAWLSTMTANQWALTLPLFILVYLLAWTVLTLPLSAYREFVIQREAGLSTTTRALWLADLLKGLLLSWVLVSALCYPIVALLKVLPHHWPLPATATFLAFSAIMLWISPWLISPLFNRFWPLDDETLRQQVRELAAKAGLDVGDVLVMDASRRSTTLNAYFTGLGNSRRVVLYDSLVQACEPDETLSVVAHELGHWRGRHLLKLFALQAISVASGLYALKLLLDVPAARSLFGLPTTDSLVVLVLLPLLSGMAGTLFAPIGAAISRHFEREADQAAFELAPTPKAFITLEQKLVRRAKADLLCPKLLHLWYASHPLPEDRIAAAELSAQDRFA
jgi:STE24 endopeptidase